MVRDNLELMMRPVGGDDRRTLYEIYASGRRPELARSGRGPGADVNTDFNAGDGDTSDGT